MKNFIMKAVGYTLLSAGMVGWAGAELLELHSARKYNDVALNLHSSSRMVDCWEETVSQLRQDKDEMIYSPNLSTDLNSLKETNPLELERSLTRSESELQSAISIYEYHLEDFKRKGDKWLDEQILSSDVKFYSLPFLVGGALLTRSRKRAEMPEPEYQI